jgi:hypothetical protein
MRKIDVPVRFTGTVSVVVPDSLDDNAARLLAEKVAIAQMLATADNEDCGEALFAACNEFFTESGLVVEEEASAIFDAAEITDVAGTWELTATRAWIDHTPPTTALAANPDFADLEARYNANPASLSDWEKGQLVNNPARFGE